MTNINIPQWLESIKPPRFVDNDTPAGRESADNRIKLAAIPRQYWCDVQEIIAGRMIDTPTFRKFRIDWTRQNRSVLITGPKGTGKSTLAAWACFDVIRAGGAVRWLQAYKMSQYIAERNRADPSMTLYHAERMPLVVIDDAHKSDGTWTNERQQLSGVVHMRHSMGLNTIMCSNMGKAELAAEPGHGTVGMFGSDTMDRFPWVFQTHGESMRFREELLP